MVDRRDHARLRCAAAAAAAAAAACASGKWGGPTRIDAPCGYARMSSRIYDVATRSSRVNEGTGQALSAFTPPFAVRRLPGP